MRGLFLPYFIFIFISLTCFAPRTYALDCAEVVGLKTSEYRLRQSDLIWDEKFSIRQFQKLIKNDSSLNVMSWNIGKGSLDRNSLEKNLLDIVNSQSKPHILVLLEKTSDALTPATMEKLSEEYPFVDFVPYNDGDLNYGILTLSTLPLKSRFVTKLDWVPNGWNQAEAATYKERWKDSVNYKKFERKFLDYEFSFNGKSLHILPFHILQSWTQTMLPYQLKRQGVIDRYNQTPVSQRSSLDTLFKQMAATYFSVAGKTAMVKELLLGKENPMKYQIQEYNRIFAERFGDDPSAQSIIAIGDSNLPSLISRGYWQMGRNLKDAFRIPYVTFPARSALEYSNYPQIKIDQALTSPGLKINTALVPPLQVSDHYPQYISVSLQGVK